VAALAVRATAPLILLLILQQSDSLEQQQTAALEAAVSVFAILTLMDSRCFFYRANVKKVYDGDTITVDIDLGFSMTLNGLKVRLIGIDTAELKSKDKQLKEKGIAARDWLRSKILDQDVYLESGGLDKYGRWLGKIHTKDGLCCNDELIKLGLAVVYDGGTKHQELLKD
jgi:micrococcal nuclease